MRILITLLNILVFSAVCSAQKQTKPLYKNPQLPTDTRVNDLLKRMTLEEKVYQLCALRLGDGDEVFKTSGVYSADYVRNQMKQHGVGHISCATTDMNAEGSVKTLNEIQKIAVEETRLGIPVIANDEALHGSRGAGSTSYPQSIALSCTWNLQLMKEIGIAIGQETYSRGVRQALGPVLDLARDPRHGRMEESYGEDPFLASRFGVAYIKGLQSNGVICSPKHFAANFVADNGRDAGNIALSERELREIHLVPYRAAVAEAGTKSMMAAYNALNGVPCSSNYWLLTDLLRKEWGFKGFTVSDWSGVNHIMGHHKLAGSLSDAAILATQAGLDVDLPRLKSYVNLIKLVQEGKIKETAIDENVKHVLRVKFEMGLFEHPYVADTLAAQLSDAPRFRQLARQAARQSIVLLKNKNNILPLSPAVKSIAVIGPNANKLQLGGYSAAKVQGASPLEGIKAVFGSALTIKYAEGCKVSGFDKSGFSEAIQAASTADVVVLVMGGQYGVTGGETQDRIDLNLMGVQEDLIKEISALGKPVIVVLNDGRPATMMNWVDKVDGVISMFFAGEEGGNALAEILSGKVNPSGKLTITFPRHTGQLPMNLLHRPYGREGGVAEYPEIKEKINPTGTEISSRYYPLFPFGFGLSYTQYKYGPVVFDKKEFAKNEKIQLSVAVTNTGKFDGDEIVQLYFTNLHPTEVTQPKMQLRAFERVNIPAGTTKQVKFVLTATDLTYLNDKLKPQVDAGQFEIFVGTNSAEGVKETFTLK